MALACADIAATVPAYAAAVAALPRSLRWRPHRAHALLITGAKGFLGRHLAVASERDGWELIAPSSTALDIRQRDRTIAEIRDWKPTVVVHLAYRRDDRLTIVDGSRHVAEGAAAVGARLIHVSTDLVFAGRLTPYTERDAPFPVLPYGQWKLEAEQVVRAIVPTATLVRPSLLYGSDHLSPAQLDVRAAVAGGSSMRFFTDEVRCPAHAADVAAAISTLARRADVHGPVHVCGPPLSRADFARHVAQWMGFDPGLVATTTIAEAGVVRPGAIVLDTTYAASLGLRCRSTDETLHR